MGGRVPKDPRPGRVVDLEPAGPGERCSCSSVRARRRRPRPCSRRPSDRGRPVTGAPPPRGTRNTVSIPLAPATGRRRRDRGGSRPPSRPETPPAPDHRGTSATLHASVRTDRASSGSSNTTRAPTRVSTATISLGTGADAVRDGPDRVLQRGRRRPRRPTRRRRSTGRSAKTQTRALPRNVRRRASRRSIRSERVGPDLSVPGLVVQRRTELLLVHVGSSRRRPDAAETTRGVRLHRAARDPERRRDVGLGKVEVVPQDKAFPLPARQRAERVHDIGVLRNAPRPPRRPAHPVEARGGAYRRTTAR